MGVLPYSDTHGTIGDRRGEKGAAVPFCAGLRREEVTFRVRFRVRVRVRIRVRV